MRQELSVPIENFGKQEQLFISIVIPAYNEELHIGPTIGTIYEYLTRKPWKSEIIVVDDGSDDTTVAEAQRAARDSQAPLRVFLNERNRGKGYSVRRGMLASQGDFALFSDADLSTPIHELDRMLVEALAGYDVVIGSRAMKNSKIELHQPFYRELMGKTFNLILRSLGLSHFHDTQCGFKLFSRRAVESIFPLTKIDRFAFDVEILLIAQRLLLPIKELPVHWRDSAPSKVSLVQDSTRMFFDVLKLRLKRRTHAAERLRQIRSEKNREKSS
jgi:dolichyl-phosphate beta-glucosyltransferase